MAIAKRRGIDHFRRNKLVDHKHEQVGYEMAGAAGGRRARFRCGAG